MREGASKRARRDFAINGFRKNPAESLNEKVIVYFLDLNKNYTIHIFIKREIKKKRFVPQKKNIIRICSFGAVIF